MLLSVCASSTNVNYLQFVFNLNSILLICSVSTNSVLETERGIFEAIMQAKLDLQSSPWPSISDSAKDLIKKMLTRDAKKRITAAEVLGKCIIACVLLLTANLSQSRVHP